VNAGMPTHNVWGLLPESRVWIGGHEVRARRELELRLENAARPSEGTLAAAFITPTSTDEATYFAGKVLPRLDSGGVVWIVFLDCVPSGSSNRWHELDGALRGVGLARTRVVHAGERLTCAGYAREADPAESAPPGAA